MIRVIDVETTGINPDADHIIEIASVDVLAGGAIANQLACLVCPPVSISPEASAIHGLVDEDVAGKPPFAEVINRFQGADALIAHNCAFERGFLGKHLATTPNGQPIVWICTWKCALRIWPEFPSHSNGALRFRLGLTNAFGISRQSIMPHRALGDAIVTAAIFVELLKHARWSQLALWSNEPALHTIFAFGKHRGQRYEAVPQDYLEWIGRSDLDADVKFSARHWLAKREVAA